jgi:8-oxo-dGTP pyrophosphatase MutT (NUDIX family)
MADGAPGDLVRVAMVILHRRGRVLLQHRDAAPGVYFSGMWGIFGGHIEPGETPEACARREMEEELGLRLPGPLPLFARRVDDGRERFVYSAALDVEPAALTLREGQGMALVAPGELDALPVVPVHRELLRAFFASRKR